MAGLNHKIVFTAKDEAGKEYKFSTAVFEPLPGNGDWQLTSFEVVRFPYIKRLSQLGTPLAAAFDQLRLHLSEILTASVLGADIPYSIASE